MRHCAVVFTILTVMGCLLPIARVEGQDQSKDTRQEDTGQQDTGQEDAARPDAVPVRAAIGADPALGDGAIRWQRAFATISPSRAEETLVLLVITNDVVLAATGDLGVGEALRGSPAWCADALLKSSRGVLEQRLDLEGRLSLQSMAVGIPSSVTGGEDRNNPARAILAVCDGHYRLLSVVVGVPDIDELLSAIEDAQEVAVMRRAESQQPADALVRALAKRSDERLPRLWRDALVNVLADMQGEGEHPGEDRLERERALAMQIQQLNDAFGPTYRSDANLRFGLGDGGAARRLAVLEQHPETRRPWCESMLPFLADADFALAWRPLVEAVWGHPPVEQDEDITELLAWLEDRLHDHTVVIAITPPQHARGLAWPPMATGSKRGQAWAELHSLMQQHSFRELNVQQVANVMKSRGYRAIDLYRPSLARYLLLEPNKDLPQVIREVDPPGRYVSLLKRSKSNLVKN